MDITDFDAISILRHKFLKSSFNTNEIENNFQLVFFLYFLSIFYFNCWKVLQLYQIQLKFFQKLFFCRTVLLPSVSSIYTYKCYQSFSLFQINCRSIKIVIWRFFRTKNAIWFKYLALGCFRYSRCTANDVMQTFSVAFICSWWFVFVWMNLNRSVIRYVEERRNSFLCGWNVVNIFRWRNQDNANVFVK